MCIVGVVLDLLLIPCAEVSVVCKLTSLNPPDLNIPASNPSTSLDSSSEEWPIIPHSSSVTSLTDQHNPQKEFQENFTSNQFSVLNATNQASSSISPHLNLSPMLSSLKKLDPQEVPPTNLNT